MREGRGGGMWREGVRGMSGMKRGYSSYQIGFDDWGMDGIST